MPILTAFYAFVLAVLTTFIASYLCKRFAPRVGLTDRKKEIETDYKAIPIGGVSIFFGFFIGSISFLDFSNQILPLLLGGGVITAVGLIDDYRELSPKTKLAIQCLGASIPLICGIEMNSIALFDLNIVLGKWGIPLTLLWIVGVTNALNLIDGLDGLATGGCIITSFFMAILSWVSGSLCAFIFSLTLMGACLSFLIYNSHPARLFLGDSGSYFIGFTLSVLTLGYHAQDLNRIEKLPFLSSLALLALPLSDTLWAIVRRTMKRENIFKPDKKHIHHLFLEKMRGYRKTVFSLYLIWLIFCILSVVNYLN